MLILSTTSDKIQVVLATASATTQMSCFVSYRDTTSTSITPIRNVVLTNSTSQVDLVGSPAASTQRVVDYLSIYNSDTIVNEVSIRFFDGTNGYRLMVTRLAIGEKIEYQEGIGFRVINNGSSVKKNTSEETPFTVSGLNMGISDKDYTNSPGAAPVSAEGPSRGYTEVLGLKTPLKSGSKYWFRYIIWFDANATTTGQRFNLFGTSPRNFLFYNMRVSLTSTTELFATCSAEYFYTRALNTTSAATTGNVAIMEGVIQAETDGFLIPNFVCELATPNSVTVKAKSFVQWVLTI